MNCYLSRERHILKAINDQLYHEQTRKTNLNQNIVYLHKPREK